MQKVINGIINVFDRYMPEPFAFGLLMTFAAMVLTWLATDNGPMQVLVAWGDGLSMLLPFITQVCLTILFAYALAHLGPVPKYLNRLASLPRSATTAYAFCAMFTSVVCLICWPLGTILGGLMAKEVALSCRSRGIQVHYPLLGGAAFAGFVVWHMGYTGSAPLFVATEGNAMQQQIGSLIPVTDTILAPFNLLTILATVITVSFFATRLEPKKIEPITDAVAESAGAATNFDDGASPRPGFAGYIENTRWLTTLAGCLLFIYIGYWFSTEGLRLDLNLVNWSFLALCLLFSRSARQFNDVLMTGGRAIVPTLLQYPLYAGVMGIMLGSGLVTDVAEFFVEIGTAETLPLLAFFSGGFINLFIPSGGAQWAVQGPAFLEAASQLGTDPALIVMGVAYGDQWTNIIHPFVIIPLLIMTGLRAAQVLPFSFILFLIATIPLAGGLLLASM
ncbi:MAG: short-chain fatty acids transporter [Limisphaerales bacterium]|jgi:short-chain fatty acids transporter